MTTKSTARASRPRAARGLGGRAPRRATGAVMDLIRTARQQGAIARKCWEKAEAAEEELVRRLGPGKIVGIDAGVFAKVVDLFAEASSVFVPKVMRRYKLVICDASGKEIRLRDRGRSKKSSKAKPKAKAKDSAQAKLF